jgi:polar amino acid transport system permease protein
MELWNWDKAFESIPVILRGLLVTLQVTVLGSLVAYVLGLLFAIVRRARIPVVDQVLWGFIELVRSTPLLIQVFVLFYLLPPATGISLSPLATGVIALGVHYACYTSEVYRAGIEAIPQEQWEAATALSLPRTRVWTDVILPQAIPRVIPALGNYTISMFKEVPLLLAIGVLDIVNSAKELGAADYRFVEPYTMAGLAFLVLSYPAALLVRKLERRVNRT